jgi:hypothetical protein
MAFIIEKYTVQTPIEISIYSAKIAEIGKPTKIIGILIQKDAFLSKGNSVCFDPNKLVLKNATNPPGKMYSSN